jgi:hypothetical protein
MLTLKKGCHCEFDLVQKVRQNNCMQTQAKEQIQAHKATARR